MKVSNVRILTGAARNGVLAFGSVTFDDCFVVHEMKIINGRKGIFVAMPTRRLKDFCPSCGDKNHLLAKYCNTCGYKLSVNRYVVDEMGKPKLHCDVAHPLTPDCRTLIQGAMLDKYEEDKATAQQIVPNT